VREAAFMLHERDWDMDWDGVCATLFCMDAGCLVLGSLGGSLVLTLFLPFFLHFSSCPLLHFSLILAFLCMSSSSLAFLPLPHPPFYPLCAEVSQCIACVRMGSSISHSTSHT
jgi:hypothetical protein